MDEKHPTNSTEVISGEDWCPQCRNDVARWNVSFESSIHTDSGYDKIRRCPHCNAMCLDDAHFGVGCLFFFLGLFGGPLLWGHVFQKLGIEIEMGGADAEIGASGYLFIAFWFANGIASMFLATWCSKRLAYRTRYTENDTTK